MCKPGLQPTTYFVIFGEIRLDFSFESSASKRFTCYIKPSKIFTFNIKPYLFLFLKRRQNFKCCLLQILGGPLGVQWLSGRVLDSRLRGCGFEPHQHHCVVSLSKTH